jgi:hypothetical protein
MLRSRRAAAGLFVLPVGGGVVALRFVSVTEVAWIAVAGVLVALSAGIGVVRVAAGGKS